MQQYPLEKGKKKKRSDTNPLITKIDNSVSITTVCGNTWKTVTIYENTLLRIFLYVL